MSEIKKQIKDFDSLTILNGTEKVLAQGTNGSTSNIELDTIYSYFSTKDINEQTDLLGIITGSGIKDSTSGITSITTDVTDNSISLSKIIQISDSKLLGNSGTSGANIEEIVLGQGLVFNGNTLDIDLGTALTITNSDLPDSAVIAGTYNNVTVDQKGIVQAGTNFNYLEASSISASVPIIYDSNTISIQEATSTSGGYLSDTNFQLFSDKLGSVNLNINGIVAGSAGSDLNGDINITTSITENTLLITYLEQITTNSLLGNYSGSNSNVDIVNIGSSLNLGSNGDLDVSYPVSTSWSPTFTGFSVDPVGIFNYVLSGKTCTISVGIITAGTSNSDSFTITLPFVVKDDLSTKYTTGYGMDNGIEGLSYIKFVADSNIVDIYFATPSGLWSTSGDKTVSFTFTYTIK